MVNWDESSQSSGREAERVCWPWCIIRISTCALQLHKFRCTAAEEPLEAFFIAWTPTRLVIFKSVGKKLGLGSNRQQFWKSAKKTSTADTGHKLARWKQTHVNGSRSCYSLSDSSGKSIVNNFIRIEKSFNYCNASTKSFREWPLHHTNREKGTVSWN